MKKILLSLAILSSLAFGASNSTIQQPKKSNEVTTKTICKDDNALEVKQRGCCSWHGGVAGCSYGTVVCSDGSYSSCTCNSSINPLG